MTFPLRLSSTVLSGALFLTASVFGASPPTPATKPSSDSAVAAHWMIEMGRYEAGNPRRDTKDYQIVEEEMLANGVRLLFAYADNLFDRQGHLEGALDAADRIAAKSGRGCIGFASCGWDPDTAFKFIRANAARRGVWKSAAGEIAISGYHNDNDSLAQVVARLRDAGIPVLFFPAVPPKVNPNDVSTAAIDIAKSWGAQGLFNFYYGAIYTEAEWLDRSERWRIACEERGLVFVPHIIAHYSAIPGNWQHYFGHGYEGLQAQMKWCLEKKIRAVELVSVNDYNDGTALQTFGSGAPMIGGRAEPFFGGLLFVQTNGFIRYLRRYLDAIATGEPPAPITKLEVFTAHTLHPRNARKWTDLNDAEKTVLRKAGYMPVSPYGPIDGNDWAAKATEYDAPEIYQDAIYVCVRTPNAARLVITSGKKSASYDLEPGENHRRLSAPGDIFTPDFFGAVSVRVESPEGEKLFEGKTGLAITPWCLPGRRRVLAQQLF